MKESILLVEDEKSFNFITTTNIERLGIADEIHVALNGDEALTLINNYFSGSRPLPRIILLDLNMPILDGFGFIEAFQRLPIPNKQKAVIAILTSSNSREDKERAHSLGIKHYLTKPVSEKELRALFQSAGVLQP